MISSIKEPCLNGYHHAKEFISSKQKEIKAFYNDHLPKGQKEVPVFNATTNLWNEANASHPLFRVIYKTCVIASVVLPLVCIVYDLSLGAIRRVYKNRTIQGINKTIPQKRLFYFLKITAVAAGALTTLTASLVAISYIPFQKVFSFIFFVGLSFLAIQACFPSQTETSSTHPAEAH